jgi:hypothetical protein
MMAMKLEPLLETLKGVFANKLTEDDREPIATFELPYVEPGGSMWALYPPRLHLWHQLIMVRCLYTLFCLRHIYYFIRLSQRLKD